MSDNVVKTFDDMTKEELLIRVKRYAFLRINNEGLADEVWEDAHEEGDRYMLRLFDELGGLKEVMKMERELEW